MYHLFYCDFWINTNKLADNVDWFGTGDNGIGYINDIVSISNSVFPKRENDNL